MRKASCSNRIRLTNQSHNPFLNKFAPGAPKNTTVVYEAAGESVKVTIDGIGSDGKPIHDEWTGKFDGKDYPVTGDPNSDARSLTKIDDRTLGFNVKNGGKATISGRIVLSADGESRTVTTSGIDPNGKKVSTTAIYDKQLGECQQRPLTDCFV